MMSDKPYADLIKGWVEDGGRVVTGGKLLDEVNGTSARELIKLWRENNRLILLDRDAVESEQDVVDQLPHTSNDEHVIAIARLSGARVLVTKDSDLMDDFRSKPLVDPRGRVISEPAHNPNNVMVQRNLLRSSGCK